MKKVKRRSNAYWTQRRAEQKRRERVGFIWGCILIGILVAVYFEMLKSCPIYISAFIILISVIHVLRGLF